MRLKAEKPVTISVEDTISIGDDCSALKRHTFHGYGSAFMKFYPKSQALLPKYLDWQKSLATEHVHLRSKAPDAWEPGQKNPPETRVLFAKSNTPLGQQPIWGFHGTNSINCENIMQSGKLLVQKKGFVEDFRQGYGQGAIGLGIYTTDNITKADQYTDVDGDGFSYVFLMRLYKNGTPDASVDYTFVDDYAGSAFLSDDDLAKIHSPPRPLPEGIPDLAQRRQLPTLFVGNFPYRIGREFVVRAEKYPYVEAHADDEVGTPAVEVGSDRAEITYVIRYRRLRVAEGQTATKWMGEDDPKAHNLCPVTQP